MKKFLILLLLTTNAYAQECFFPAHNYVPYVADFTSTGWTRTSTITNDTTTTSPPRVYNVNTTFKGVGVAAQSNFVYGTGGFNKYVVDGATYLLSAYVKYGNFQFLRFGLTGSASWGANFDIQNGTYTGTISAGLTNPTIEAVGDGWYRISVSYVGNVTALSSNFRPLFTYIATGSGTGSTMAGGETFYFAGVQAMDARVPLPERKKYVETTGIPAVWAAPAPCAILSSKW